MRCIHASWEADSVRWARKAMTSRRLPSMRLAATGRPSSYAKIRRSGALPSRSILAAFQWKPWMSVSMQSILAV